jgi:hypothetical protein
MKKNRGRGRAGVKKSKRGLYYIRTSERLLLYSEINHNSQAIDIFYLSVGKNVKKYYKKMFFIIYMYMLTI